MSAFPEPLAPAPVRLELDAVYQVRDASIAKITFGPGVERPRGSGMTPGGIAPDIFFGGYCATPDGRDTIIIAAHPADGASG